MTDDRSVGDDAAEIAAEYALGLLTGDELGRACELDRRNPFFHAEVARWRGRLAPLADAVASVEPPARAWDNITAATITLNKTGGGNVIELRRRVWQWRASTAAMTALAACLAVILLIRPPPPLPTAPAAPAPMVAMLGTEGKDMKVVASWDPSVRQLVLAVPGDLSGAPGHSHELWVIPAHGQPHSLGTMPAGRQMHMKLAHALASLLQQGATIAISLEPRGGSPTGKPTGPVVAAGALRAA